MTRIRFVCQNCKAVLLAHPTDFKREGYNVKTKRYDSYTGYCPRCKGRVVLDESDIRAGTVEIVNVEK